MIPKLPPVKSEMVRKTLWLLRRYLRLPPDGDPKRIREWKLAAGPVVTLLVERLAATDEGDLLTDWIECALLLIGDFDEELDARLAEGS